MTSVDFISKEITVVACDNSQKKKTNCFWNPFLYKQMFVIPCSYGSTFCPNLVVKFWFEFWWLLMPWILSLKSSPLSAAYMRQWIGSALVQIMACRLFGAQPLSKQMLNVISIGSVGTNFSEILVENRTFSFKKMRLKMSSAKMREIS